MTALPRRTHHVKSVTPYFDAVWDGTKPYEVRINDRGYQYGDTIFVHEFDLRRSCRCMLLSHEPRESCGKYTGRFVEATVGFVLTSLPSTGKRRGLQLDGHVVFGLVDMVHSDADRATHDQDSHRQPTTRSSAPRAASTSSGSSRAADAGASAQVQDPSSVPGDAPRAGEGTAVVVTLHEASLPADLDELVEEVVEEVQASPLQLARARVRRLTAEADEAQHGTRLAYTSTSTRPGGS